jgi:hypothetical protein
MRVVGAHESLAKSMAACNPPARPKASWFVTLKNPATNATVHVVGVGHLSIKSQEDVRKVIRVTRPDTVCVETDCQDGARQAALICSNLQDCRAKTILPPLPPVSPLSVSAFLLGAAIVPWLPIVSWSLYTSDEMLGELARHDTYERLLDTSSGHEMSVAIEEGMRCGSSVYAIDRCSTVTAHRQVYGKQPSRQTADIQSPLSQPVQSLMELGTKLAQLSTVEPKWSADDITICRALARAAFDCREPNEGTLDCMSVAITDERDQILAHKIWRATNEENGTVVAVVGANHLAGIQKYFGRTTDADIALLNRMPEISTYQKLGLSVVHNAPINLYLAVLLPACIVRLSFEVALFNIGQAATWCGFLGLGVLGAGLIVYKLAPSYRLMQRVQFETRADPAVQTLSLYDVARSIVLKCQIKAHAWLYVAANRQRIDMCLELYPGLPPYFVLGFVYCHAAFIYGGFEGILEGTG